MESGISSLEELPGLAGELLSFASNERIFLFYGDMGAGKTTLIKEMCNCLGVTDMVSSPTFSIVNEYESSSGTIFHFDFYRLKHESEALDLGYEDYFYSGRYCFIEWPEKIPNLIPRHYISINIAATGETSRHVIADKH